MKKRPLGLTIFGALFIIGGLLGLLSPAMAKSLSESAALTSHQQLQVKASMTSWWLAMSLAMGGASLAAGIGLLMLRRWAWWFTLLLAGVSTLQGIGGILAQPAWSLVDALVLLFTFASNGVVIWYLLRPLIKAQFVSRQVQS